MLAWLTALVWLGSGASITNSNSMAGWGTSVVNSASLAA